MDFKIYKFKIKLQKENLRKTNKLNKLNQYG